MLIRFTVASLLAWFALFSANAGTANAEVEGRYKRWISYQDKRDLFYNYYVGPNPSGTTGEMYVSPVPVPPHVGHTYITYQPFMPHEYMYHHHRSHYAHTPGAGWTRAKVRYGTRGLILQDKLFHLSPHHP